MKNRWAGKKIEIGGLIYTVEYFKPKPTRKVQLITMKAELDYEHRILRLLEGMTPSEEIQSIIHEIMHGINDALFPAQLLTECLKEEEVIVEPYSRMLCSALRSAGLLKE